MKKAKTKNEFEYVISACLLGIPCRYNGAGKPDKKAIELFLKGKAVPLCPEIIGGLKTPRPACEIVGGAGIDVLNGKADIKDQKGKKYNQQFIKGAEKSLEITKKLGIKKALLKSGSPSCGAVYIYSGDFSGKKKKGKGVFAALLTKNKIHTEER